LVYKLGMGHKNILSVFKSVLYLNIDLA